MHPPKALRPNTWRTPVRALLATALCLALGLVVPPATANAADPELMTNADFSSGATGWTTNAADQLLTVSGGNAQLTSKTGGSATLNDRPNAVSNKTKGTKYVATARVRTNAPTVKGYLRIREVLGSEVNSSSTAFTLADTAWATVTLDVTTVYAGSELDFNLQASKLPVGSNLQVDWVSVKVAPAVAPTPTPPAPVPPAPVPPAPQQPGGGSCDAPPPSGTLFGTNISTVNQTFPDALAGMDSTFGKVKVIRHFSPGLPLSWSSRNAGLLKGRTVVMSFKVPPAEITSGKHDAFFQNWFKTAPKDQTIYWSYFHEPENNINAGDFTAAQYRAAWTRLANLEKEACNPSLHATLILTGWTMNPSSKRDYRVYDAGSAYVKVLAFDPYNGLYQDRDYYEAPESLFGNIATKMKADGRPWGIAETGAWLVKGDESGTKRAAWLTSMGPYLKQNKALFATYFNTIGANGDFRLMDAPSLRAWSALVKQ